MDLEKTGRIKIFLGYFDYYFVLIYCFIFAIVALLNVTLIALRV